MDFFAEDVFYNKVDQPPASQPPVDYLSYDEIYEEALIKAHSMYFKGKSYTTD